MLAEEMNRDSVVERGFSEAMRAVINTKAMGETDRHPTYSLLAAYADMVL